MIFCIIYVGKFDTFIVQMAINHKTMKATVNYPDTESIDFSV